MCFSGLDFKSLNHSRASRADTLFPRGRHEGEAPPLASSLKTLSRATEEAGKAGRALLWGSTRAVQKPAGTDVALSFPSCGRSSLQQGWVREGESLGLGLGTPEDSSLLTSPI